MNLLKVLEVLPFLLLVTACSGGGSGGDRTADNERGEQYLGELDKKMSELYRQENEPYLKKCDHDWKERALEISRALESRRGEIETFYKQHLENTSKDKFDYIEMGTYTFLQNKQPVVGEDRWDTYSYSWQQAYQKYIQVKDLPVNKDWASLNFYVRGMVMDEERRIERGSNTGLSKDAGPTVQAIYNKVKACYEDNACTLPTLTRSELLFLDQGDEGYFSGQLFYNSSRYSFSELRDLVRKLLNYTKRNYQRYEFRPSDIAVVNGNTLEIPMDLSTFGEAAQKFASYVESVWNNAADFSIRIVQKNRPAATYLVSVDKLVGGRAYVLDKDMQLYDLDDMKVLPHEFGHVLGFRDNYYTTWESSTCTYNSEANDGDIMSNHEGGQVLPRHWEDLKKAYWKQ